MFQLVNMKYKNISDKDLSLVGVGLVKAGEVVEVNEPINNANFQLLKKEQKDEEIKSANQSQNNNKK